MSKSLAAKLSKLSQPRQKQKSIAADSPMAAPATTADEAVRLLVEADSFLRLGLLDKAIALLAKGVRREPSLRVLREHLVKLYVVQGRPKKAIAELWALLSPCENPQEEVGLLRYIIRLGGKTPAAEQRLQAILSHHQLEPPKSSDDPVEATLTASGVGKELRAYLDRHRPSMDLAQILTIPDAETQRSLNGLQHRPAEITRPNAVQGQALSEAVALSEGTLKEQLGEIDVCLQKLRYAEARRLLQTLARRHPHSKRVQARLLELEQGQPKLTPEFAISVLDPAEKTFSADFHAAQTLPPCSSGTPPETTDLPAESSRAGRVL
jgi:tetratricopeptide (TPR) repeat protein